MARKTNTSQFVKTEKPPKTLDEHVFFGLSLDEEQRKFRDCVWSPDYDIIFCNAKAGTGKTLIATATSMLLCEYGIYSKIYYVSAAGVHEYKQGLLPGTLEEKSKFLFTPLNQAVLKLGYDPERIVVSEFNMLSQKGGDSYISTVSDSYIRGINIGDGDNRVICIIDESQNFTREGLRTLLTRMNTGCKVIVIGHHQQCDLKYSNDSGFSFYLDHFRDKERCAVCKLTTNHRSWIAQWADEV